MGDDEIDDIPSISIEEGLDVEDDCICMDEDALLELDELIWPTLDIGFEEEDIAIEEDMLFILMLIPGLLPPIGVAVAV